MRRITRAAWAALFSVLVLPGCFPVVATGVGVGALMISDRRTSGAYVEDEAIEWKVGNRIGEQFKERAHVNATSFNRTVLLTGETPDAAAKAEIGRLAAGVENVRNVVNELDVAAPSGFGARSNDAYITSKVKARFLEANRFSANVVKVVTEAGVVYLMGLVTRPESEAAAEIARTTAGVKKVVRVFEFISADEARRLDNRSESERRVPASTDPKKQG